MPQISVIVPVYKVEKYLHRCINSILNQTYRDFELILIDDGSPDNSGHICDEYAAKDGRIRVIHQKNSGASAARNAGLDCAVGDYVVFCDSDDLVAPMWLEHLVTAVAPDTLPVCSFCHDMAQLGKEKELTVDTGMVFPRSDYYLYNQCGIAGYLWNAAYSNQVIRENCLRLREQKEQGDYNEDLLFNLQYVRYVNNIVYTGYSDYLYDLHEDSLSRGNQRYYFEKYEEKYQLWKSFLEENQQEDQQHRLADTYLYHFLTALNGKPYKKFHRVVNSPVVQHCVMHLQDCAESPTIVRLIRRRNTLALWIKYKLHEMKGRLK